jgi:predicted O-methyltransferase YrrM
MTLDGTATYQDVSDLPDLVRDAVRAATDAGFEFSCHPAQGRLLALLAAARTGGVIGETGTGCGVGLAWLACAARADVRLVSVERDPSRAAVARRVFAGDDRVTIRCGDWTELAADGPFNLLVLDGGGQGKGSEAPIAPGDWLALGGTLVIDDFTPFTTWPPTHDGAPDTARSHWLTHPDLLATEIPLTDSTVAAVRWPAPTRRRPHRWPRLC